MKTMNFEDKIYNVINKIFIGFVILIVAYPLIYVISASFSDPAYVYSGEMWLFPKGFTLEGYQRVLQNNDIWTGYRNTIFYTFVGTVINLLFTLPCAYALSRKDFSGRNIFMAIFIFTMFFGGGMIPTYLLIKDLKMINTIWVMLLPDAVAVWNIIICRTYFQTSIPKEMQESAQIDGCTNTKLFIDIILPLSAPIIAVMALFYGVGHWNSFFSALIYLSKRSMYPLQLILREILVQNQMSEMMSLSSVESMAEQAKIADIIKYAVMIVSTLPIIMVYPFLQKYFVKGVMIGAVKG